MNGIDRRTALALAGAGALGVATAEESAQADEGAASAKRWPGPNATPADWPQFMGYADHRAYAQSETRLTPRNVGSLRLIWTSPDPHAGQAPPTVVDDAVFSGGETINRQRASTGALEWSHHVSGSADTAIAYAHGILVAGTRDPDTVVALNAATGKVLWSRPIDGLLEGSVTIRDTSVYVAGRPSLVNCLSLATGAVRWSRLIPSDDVWGSHSSPTVAGGRVFVGTGGNAVVTAFAASTGAVLWQHRLHRSSLSGLDVTPLAADPAGRLFGGTPAGTAFALDQASGRVRWYRRLGGDVNGGVTLTPTALLVPTYDVGLVALYPDTGAIRWTYPVSTYTGMPPASGGGVAYLTMPRLGNSNHSSLRAVDLRDGRELASIPVPAFDVACGPAISRGRLYLNGLVEPVFCLGLPT